MVANVSSTLTDWSTVAADNHPYDTEQASGLLDDLRAIQSGMRKETMFLRRTNFAQTATVTAAGGDSTLTLTDVYSHCNVSGASASSTVASMVMESGRTYNLHFVGDNNVALEVPCRQRRVFEQPVG